MATDSGGDELTQAVITCEGDIKDPHFPLKFHHLVKRLKKVIFHDNEENRQVNVHRVEPWNSVRVTFTLPREAAVRLRQLAQAGDATLRELGILSVQLEGDQVISLTIAGRYEAQEIVFRTESSANSTSNGSNIGINSISGGGASGSSTVGLPPGGPVSNSVSELLTHVTSGTTVNGVVAPSVGVSVLQAGQGEESSGAMVPQPGAVTAVAASVSAAIPATSGTGPFRSPNVVAPVSSQPIPYIAAQSGRAPMTSSMAHTYGGTSASGPFAARPQSAYVGPYPFASMTHAAHAMLGQNNLPLARTRPPVPSVSTMVSASPTNPTSSALFPASTSTASVTGPVTSAPMISTSVSGAGPPHPNLPSALHLPPSKTVAASVDSTAPSPSSLLPMQPGINHLQSAHNFTHTSSVTHTPSVVSSPTPSSSPLPLSSSTAFLTGPALSAPSVVAPASTPPAPPLVTNHPSVGLPGQPATLASGLASSSLSSTVGNTVNAALASHAQSVGGTGVPTNQSAVAAASRPVVSQVMVGASGTLMSGGSVTGSGLSLTQTPPTTVSSPLLVNLLQQQQQQQQIARATMATVNTQMTAPPGSNLATTTTVTNTSALANVVVAGAATIPVSNAGVPLRPDSAPATDGRLPSRVAGGRSMSLNSPASLSPSVSPYHTSPNSPVVPATGATTAMTSVGTPVASSETNLTLAASVTVLNVRTGAPLNAALSSLAPPTPLPPAAPTSDQSIVDATSVDASTRLTPSSISNQQPPGRQGAGVTAVSVAGSVLPAAGVGIQTASTANAAVTVNAPVVRPIVGVGIRPSPQQIQAFRHPSQNVSLANRLPNPPPYPGTGLRPTAHMVHNSRLPVIPGGATVTAVPATIAASISASSNPSSSSVSANLLDGMVCVNDTYMLPGRNNLSITVVTDPQRTAAINRGVTAASPAVPVVASSSAPAIPATSTTASTATSPSNAITISRTASEMEHKKQLLINPLTGHLEPSPSESSDSDVEVTKDLENSLLMQSLLDNTSPNFFDRPLSDSLFSDEDTDKNNTGAPAAPPASIETEAAVVKAAGIAAKEKETGEGIKLRLKLEKSEPTAVNYVAFVNVPSKPSSSASISSTSSSDPATPVSGSSSANSPAEPRVPPLHISLKGRNLTVLSPKKETKKKKVRPRHDSGDEDEDFHRGDKKLVKRKRVAVLPNYSEDYDEPVLPVQLPQPASPPLPLPNHSGSASNNVAPNNSSLGGDSVGESIQVTFKPKVKTKADESVGQDIGNSAECSPLESQSNVQPPAVISPARLNSVDDDGMSTQTATVEESVNSGSVVNCSPFVTTSERTCTDSTSSSTVVPALVIPTTPAITATLAPSSTLLSSLSTVSVTSTDDSSVSNATSATGTSTSTLDAPPSSASVVEEKKNVMVGPSVGETTVTNLSPAFAGEMNIVDQATSNPVPDISSAEDVSEISENCRPVELEETEIVVPQRSADAEPVSCPTPERDPLALNKPNEVTVVNNISHLKCQVEETLNDAKREEVALDFYQESVGTDGLNSHLSMKDEVVKGLRPKAGNLSEDLHKLSVLNNVHKNALSRDAKHLHVNPVSVEVRSATVHHDHQGHHEHQLVTRLVDQAKDSNQLTLETLKAPKADLVPTEGRGTEDGGNTQGEDSGIESLDALSEKSPNQSESPPRREDKDFASAEQTPQTQPSRPPPPPPPPTVTSQSSETGKSSTCESPARVESPAPAPEPAPMSTPTLVPAPTEATPPPVVVPNALVPSTLLSDNTVESLSTKPSSSDLLPPPQTSTVEESVATITEDHDEAEEGTKAIVEVPVSDKEEHLVTSGSSSEICASPIDRQPEKEKLLPDEEVNMADEVAVVDIQDNVTVEKASEVGSPLISKESDAPTDADETEQMSPATDPSDVVADVSKDVDDLSKGATDLSTIRTDPSGLNTELPVVATDLPEVTTDLPEVATDDSEIKADPLGLTDLSDAANDLPEIKTDHPEVICNPLVDLTDNLVRNEEMEHSTSIVESSEEVKEVEESVEKIQDATIETSINEDSVVEEQVLKKVEAVTVEPLELEERVEPSEQFESNEAITEVTEVDKVAEIIEQVDEPNTDPIETVEEAVPNLIPVAEESVTSLVSVDDTTVSIEKPSSPTPQTVPSATIQNGPVPSPPLTSLSDQQPLSTPSDTVNSPVTVVAPSSPQQNEMATSLSPESIGNSPSSTPDPASPVAEESLADSSAQPAPETRTNEESANPDLQETVSITASEASPLTESVGNCIGLTNDNEMTENAFNDRAPKSPSPPSASAAPTSSNNVILTTVRDNPAISKPATPTQVVIVSSTSAGSSSSLVNSTGLFAMTSGSKMVPIRLVTLPKGLDLATTASMSQGSPVKILVSKMSPGKLQGTPVSAVVMKSVIVSTASALVNQTASQTVVAPSVSSASFAPSESNEAQQEKRIALADVKEEEVKVEKKEPIDNVKVERDDEVVDDESEPRFHPQSPFHGFPSQNATPEDPDIDGEVDPDDEAQSDRSNNSYSSPLYEPIPSLDPKNDLEGAVSEDGGANSPNPPALQPVVGSLDENRITDALTIEIPNAPEMVTRCTRSGTRIISPDIRRSPRQQSPLLAPNNSVSNAGEEKTVPARKSTRRKRQESGSSGTSDPPSRDGVVGATDSGRQSPSDALDSLALSQRPTKRKCSENASELIKACMGLDDTPRKNVAPGENANLTTGTTSATTGLLGSVKKQRCGSIEDTTVLKRNDVSDDDSLGDLPSKVPRQNRSNSRNRNSKRNVAKTKEAGSSVNLLQQPVSTTPPPSSTRRSVRHAAGATTGLASVAGATAAALGVNVVGKATTPSIENNGAAFKATARRKTRSSAALADPENDSDQTMATAATGQATPPSLQQPATTPTTGSGPTPSDAVSTTSVTGPCSTPLTTSNNKRRRVSRDSR